MKKVLFTNLEIQIKEWAWANAVIMNKWNFINASDFNHNHEMNEISKQTKNKSCKSSVNKKHKHEKVREYKCEHEKNKEQEQNEKCKHEHKKRNFNVDINNDDKKSENY